MRDVWRIGVDVGGTFTDVALVNERTGTIGLAKVPTTPPNFDQGVLTGIHQAMQKYGIAVDTVSLLAHATTVVTNALLEGKGARCGFIATRGFRDILELRRSCRADLYDVFQDGPAVLVPRRHRYEITERVDAQGKVLTALKVEELDDIVKQIKAAELETVAVSLMFSFLNDAHEKEIGKRLRAALPGVQVFLSHEILPEVREFERASTTAVCAYVGPVLSNYLVNLQEALSKNGLPKLHIMGSSGGVFDAAEALRMPAAAVESGPAAGVVAAALVGRQLGIPNVLAFDMGGTTAKAAVIANHEISVTTDYEVGGSGHVSRWQHGTGHPIRVPVIDLAEISSGGGSIVHVDPAGALKVGPKSAGSAPGPAGYGRGGTLPTVSDANFVLGYLNREALLDGALKVDFAAAERAIQEHVAVPLGLSVPDAASKIIEIVNNAMSEALRIVSVERGVDPREFTLVGFGGAGPVHVVALADLLDIPKVLVPPAPGAFSALGLVATDLRRDYSRTLFSSIDDVDPERLGSAVRALKESAQEMYEAANVAPENRQLVFSVDVRYRRQSYELTIPVEGDLEVGKLAQLKADFFARHKQQYGHASAVEPVVIVNLRLAAFGKLRKLDLRQVTGAAGRPVKHRDVWFASTGFVDTPVHWRDSFDPGTTIDGPAVVESLDSTTVILPGWRMEVDSHGYMHITKVRQQ
jgi:N-methylhydantoinase A